MRKKGFYSKELGKEVARAAKPGVITKVHIIPNQNHTWSVVKDGRIKATKVFDSQEEAIKFSCSLVRNGVNIALIHGTDGLVKRKVKLKNKIGVCFPGTYHSSKKETI